MTCIITPGGEVKFVWDDQMAFLRELGLAEIVRASHVEPTPDGEWIADMGPSGGPVLGPYQLRCEALAAERQWLAQNRGL